MGGIGDGRGRRAATRVAGIALCAVTFFTGSAEAGEIVGSTLTQSPNSGFVTPLTLVAHVQPADNPTPNPLSPTTAGVVTSVRIKHGGTSGTPGTAGLRILGTDFSDSIASRNLTATTPVEAANFAWPASLPAGIFEFIPTAGGAGVIPKGIPIATDQRLGYANISGSLPQIVQYHGFDGHNWTTLITDPIMNHTSGSASYRIVYDNVETLIQYTVEPDADADGYGDDTQDACPADAATRVACAAAIPALSGTDPASPANNNAPKVQGTAFTGSDVDLFTTSDCSGTPLASGTAADLAGGGIAISVADNTTTTVYASMTIPSGTSGCSPGIAYQEVTPPDLSISDVALPEGDPPGSTTATLTVQLSSPASSGGVAFDIATADASAQAGSDYAGESLTGQVIPENQSTYVFDVTVNSDLMDEGNETFFVNVTNVSGAALVDSQGQVTIQDDDAQPTISVDDVAVNEGASGNTPLTFTVSLSNPSSDPISVNAATSDGSALAPGDYATLPSTPLSFPSGTTTKTVTVQVVGDLGFEPDETFVVILSGAANAGILDNQGEGTIRNDDARPADPQPADPRPADPATTLSGDPKCKRLDRKLKRQRAKLARADTSTKRDQIRANIEDTRKRLAGLACTGA